MDADINNTVGQAVGLSQARVLAQAQMTLLKKVLNNQSDLITTLVNSAVPKLAQDAELGGRVSTHA